MSILCKCDEKGGIEDVGRAVQLPPAKGSKAKGRIIPRTRLEQLRREGKTGELEAYGVEIATDEPVPEGKQRTGSPQIVKSGGKPVRRWTLEDAPAAPTPEQKLVALGLTVDDLKALVADV